MYRVKISIILAGFAIAATACFNSGTGDFVITGNKAYEASLFRQHCAICHGPEGHGKTLVDGTVVPSLREGEFKAKTEAEIRNQIADGGNGMVPFRGLLTARELDLMTGLVHDDLRK